jgi:hypothetical protein
MQTVQDSRRHLTPDRQVGCGFFVDTSWWEASRGPLSCFLVIWRKVGECLDVWGVVENMRVVKWNNKSSRMQGEGTSNSVQEGHRVVGYKGLSRCPGQDLSAVMSKSWQPWSHTQLGSSTQYPADLSLPRFPASQLSSGKNISLDHTTWYDLQISKKWYFVHTKKWLDHTMWYEQKQFTSWSHHVYLVHTIKNLFTPCKFCSHDQDFIHIMKCLHSLTPISDHTLQAWFTPSCP